MLNGMFAGKKSAVGIADCNSTSLSPDAMTPSLFYPDFSKACSIGPKEHWSGDEEFIVTLTNESGQRLVLPMLYTCVYT